MKSAESFSHPPKFQNALDDNLDDSPIQLMAIDEVIHQNDVELLKHQLAAAHQLLNYRQNVVHSLTEQIHLQETHLLHAEQQVDDLQQQCQSQTVELTEMRSICADLRSQLKRQTRRQSVTSKSSLSQPGASQALSSQRVHSLGFEIQGASPTRAAVSFGYESSASLEPAAKPLTKAPPVEAWSAPQIEEIREEITFCQKLTTFVVSSSARVSTLTAENEPETVLVRSPQSRPRQMARNKPVVRHRSSIHHSVELPHFAVG